MLSIFWTLIDDISDRELFEKLYFSYEKQMFYVSQKILKDEYLAEDATQNAFTGVAANIGKVRTLSETETRSYLLTSAKNAAFDILRKLNKSEIVNIDDFYNLSDPSAENNLEQVESTSFVVSILKKLPQHYTDILYLHYVIGLTPSEISKQLNRSLNTVKKQISRGKKIFIEFYEKENN